MGWLPFPHILPVVAGRATVAPEEDLEWLGLGFRPCKSVRQRSHGTSLSPPSSSQPGSAQPVAVRNVSTPWARPHGPPQRSFHPNHYWAGFPPGSPGHTHFLETNPQKKRYHDKSDSRFGAEHNSAPFLVRPISIRRGHTLGHRIHRYYGDQILNPNPPFDLCFTQAMLKHGTDAMFCTAAFSLILEILFQTHIVLWPFEPKICIRLVRP